MTTQTTPRALVPQLLALACPHTNEDHEHQLTRDGVQALANWYEHPQPAASEPAARPNLDRMIAELDNLLSRQMDAILHHPDFQALEASWRSLKSLVERTDFGENIRLRVLNVTTQELSEDFDEAAEISQSCYYRHVYASGFGQYGGEPVAAVIGDFAFTQQAPDIRLLHQLATVGAMAHAPFISSVSARFFGLQHFGELGQIQDLNALLAGNGYLRWHGLRTTEDARYLGLTCPRFLLRLPYDPLDNPTHSFCYQEQTQANHQHYLWGNSAYLLASTLTRSFARYRWCPNIIGPRHGGEINGLPIPLFESMGQWQSRIPTEVLITDRRELELAEAGFIPLTQRKDSGSAAFFSANSVQKPQVYAQTESGQQQALNYRLATQLPYLMIICRLAHYLKVLQREQIGAWKERQDLQRELNRWIRQYIADQENPPADVRSRRPLRAAAVEVLETPGEAGWYQVRLMVRPHFKYMGASFELSLVGRLDREPVAS